MANNFIYKGTRLKVGDTIKISYNIQEEEKTRTQEFTGLLISIKGNNNDNRSFTIRKISKSGIGVEKIFPLNSPFIQSIKLIKKSNNQKAKIYYIRNLSQKETKKKLYKITPSSKKTS